MFFCLDGSFELLGPEMRRRGQYHHVHVGIKYLLVGIKADKTMVVVNFDLRLLGKIGAAGIQMVLQDVGQSNDFDAGSRIQNVQGGARPPVAAADHANLQNRAIRGHVHKRYGRVGLFATCQHCSGAHRRDRTDESSAVKIPPFLFPFLVSHIRSPLK